MASTVTIQPNSCSSFLLFPRNLFINKDLPIKAATQVCKGPGLMLTMRGRVGDSAPFAPAPALPPQPGRCHSNGREAQTSRRGCCCFREPSLRGGAVASRETVDKTAPSNTDTRRSEDLLASVPSVPFQKHIYYQLASGLRGPDAPQPPG